MISKAVLFFCLLLLSLSSFAQLEKANLYVRQSHIYFDQDKFNEAVLYADSALMIAVRSNLPDSISNAYRWLYEIHSAKKDYEGALENFRMAVIYRDSAVVDMLIESNYQNLVQRDSILAAHRKEVDGLKNDVVWFLGLADQDRRSIMIIFFGIVAIALVAIFIFYRKNTSLTYELDAVKAEVKELQDLRQRLYEVLLRESKVIMDFEQGRQDSHELTETWNQIVRWVGYQTQDSKMLPIEFDCGPLAKEIVVKFQDKLAAKNLIPEIFIPDDQKVFADREMITVVMECLILNAIRFTKEHGRITIFSGKNNDLVTLGIKDSGIGMTEEQRQKLFSSDQAPSSLQSGTEGLGIGLMLSKYLVERNGGVMYVESVAGTGSTFYFSVPGKKN